jgi:hypothetical protein
MEELGVQCRTVNASEGLYHNPYGKETYSPRTRHFYTLNANVNVNDSSSSALPKRSPCIISDPYTNTGNIDMTSIWN